MKSVRVFVRIAALIGARSACASSASRSKPGESESGVTSDTAAGSSNGGDKPSARFNQMHQKALNGLNPMSRGVRRESSRAVPAYSVQRAASKTFRRDGKKVTQIATKVAVPAGVSLEQAREGAKAAVLEQFQDQLGPGDSFKLSFVPPEDADKLRKQMEETGGRRVVSGLKDLGRGAQNDADGNELPAENEGEGSEGADTEEEDTGSDEDLELNDDEMAALEFKRMNMYAYALARGPNDEFLFGLHSDGNSIVQLPLPGQVYVLDERELTYEEKKAENTALAKRAWKLIKKTQMGKAMRGNKEKQDLFEQQVFRMRDDIEKRDAEMRATQDELEVTREQLAAAEQLERLSKFDNITGNLKIILVNLIQALNFEFKCCFQCILRIH
jgi:hypothetical protein